MKYNDASNTIENFYIWFDLLALFR